MRAPPILLLTLLAVAAPLRAQDSVIVIRPDAVQPDSLQRGGLPPGVVSSLLRRFNDSATTRFWGDMDLPPGSLLSGTVGVFRGSVRLAGRIEGSLLVINGSLAVLPGGTVTGDVLVVGGRISVAEGGRIEGDREVYWDAAPVVRDEEGRLVRRGGRRPLSVLSSATARFQKGPVRASLTVGTGGTYNRIEGLPVVFGPSLDWHLAPATHLNLNVRGILRTSADGAGLREDFGYRANGEFRFGQPQGFALGVLGYSEVQGIEDHPLSRSEVGWSSLLFQRDQWDYYLRQGVGVYSYAYLTPALRLDLDLRRDRESSVLANDPWSLFRNTDRWRPNPLVDDGHYVVAHARLLYDTRDDRNTPSSGWWISAEGERDWSNDVAPLVLPTSIRSPLPTDRTYAFNRVRLDLRRYNWLTPRARLNLRFLAEGWAGGDPLPLQRRVALGGADYLPGYEFRSFNCAPAGYNDPSRAALCDRLMLVQAEYRTRLDLGLGRSARGPGWNEVDRYLGLNQLDLVFFSDAGKSWLSGPGPGRVPNNRIPSFKEWKADVGVGLDLGGAGVYLARALTDSEPLRVALRLQHRF